MASQSKLVLDVGLVDRSLAQDSLGEFIRQAWLIIEPTTPLRWNWHLGVTCEHLEAVAAGEITRLIVNVPPRSGKSLFTSVFFPAWLWVREPSERLVFASYSAALAVKLSTDRRAVIQSRWYQQNWGASVRLADDANLKTEFQNSARGHMIATSVGASITGKGGAYLVVDDLINPAQAESELERESALRWFAETLGPRLDNKATGRIVVIEQRTHQADLTGTLLAQGGWTHLCLPAQFQRRTIIALPRTHREIVKAEGDLLWPEREGKAELDAARAQLGNHAYTSQYLQSPVARGGNLFKREDFGVFEVPPRRFDSVVLSLDTAYGKGQTGDYSAGVVIAHVAERGADSFAPGFYVLHVWRDRVPFGELKAQVEMLAAQWRPQSVLVEDSASGQSLIQELKAETSLPVVPVRADSDKFSRAAAVDPVVSGRQVYLAGGAAWAEDFLDELAGFPSWAHDDQCDAFVQAVNYLRHRPSNKWRAFGWSGSVYELSDMIRKINRPTARPIPTVVRAGIADGQCAGEGCGVVLGPSAGHAARAADGTAARLCALCYARWPGKTRDFMK